MGGIGRGSGGCGGHSEGGRGPWPAFFSGPGWGSGAGCSGIRPAEHCGPEVPDLPQPQLPLRLVDQGTLESSWEARETQDPGPFANCRVLCRATCMCPLAGRSRLRLLPPLPSPGQSGGLPAQLASGDATWPGRGAQALLSIWCDLSLSGGSHLPWFPPTPPPQHHGARATVDSSLGIGPRPCLYVWGHTQATQRPRRNQVGVCACSTALPQWAGTPGYLAPEA